jgi:CTP:molybdopterin cytidylyltransferase MocA
VQNNQNLTSQIRGAAAHRAVIRNLLGGVRPETPQEIANNCGKPIRSYYRELNLLEGEQGARTIIFENGNDLARIPLPEAAFDVDWLEEAARLPDLHPE